MGQTKFQNKINQNSKGKLKKIENMKNEASIKFSKSNQFFQNIQTQSEKPAKKERIVTNNVQGSKYKL